MTGDAAPAERARPGGRVRKGTLPPLPQSVIERWLLSSGLAFRNSAGAVELTPHGHRIAGSLTRLG